jgi:hypothetical protein
VRTRSGKRDSTRKRTVLYGGQDVSANAPLGDTWEWDGQYWTERQIWGPPALAQFAMVSDEARGHLVLFGGMLDSNAAASSGDTWEGYERPT